MEFKLRKWSSVNLIYECCTVLAQFFQASCSGWNLIYGWILSPSICCTSPSPVNWFTLLVVEGFTFFRSTPGCRMKGEQCSVLYHRGWTTLECGHFIAASRTNTLVFVRILLGMSVTSLCNPLGSYPARQRSLNYFDSPSNQHLLTELIFDKKQQHSKFWLMINFPLKQHSLPCRTKRKSLAVKREHDDISLVSAD